MYLKVKKVKLTVCTCMSGLYLRLFPIKTLYGLVLTSDLSWIRWTSLNRMKTGNFRIE